MASWQPRWWVAFIDRFSMERVILKTDGEAVTARLAGLVRDARAKKGLKTEVQLTPRCSSQSLGAIGKVQQMLQGQVRCLALDIKRRYDLDPSPGSPIWLQCPI